MSGLCGIIHFDAEPGDPSLLESMSRVAVHRGPDGVHCTWPEPHVGLAQLFLDIGSDALPRPLHIADRGLTLTADARLDNRDELIALLGSEGLLPPSQPVPDAHIILAAWRHWGRDCARHLIGDFAFALWDARNRRLFAARDPMAMRPFYYVHQPPHFFFASEIGQLLTLPTIHPRLHEAALAAHLVGPIAPSEWTFHEGVMQLPPAFALTVDGRGLHSWRYWDTDPEFRIRLRREEEYEERFRELFTEAVKARMRIQKPVGLMLSGGMDSGSIASVAGLLMSRGETQAPLRTYSWAFPELARCDERHVSSVIVSHYGLASTDVVADDWWPLRDYPAHGPHVDDPLIWPYQALTDHTLQTARSEGMAVVLTGDRGDEMVGDWIFDPFGMLLAGRWRTLYREVRALGERDHLSTLGAVRKHLLRPLLSKAGRGAPRLDAARGALTLPDWVRPEFAARVGLSDILREHVQRSSRAGSALRQRHQRIFSPAGARIAALGERMHAHHGLGYADPWSDRRLASFLLAIPQWMIQRVREPKRLARRAMRGIMPDAALRAAGKIEPLALFDRGLKDRALPVVRDLMSDSRAAARGYLDEEVLRMRYNAFLRGESQPFDFWWPLTL